MTFKHSPEEELRTFYETADTDWIVRESKKLNTIEEGQTFKEYEESARYVYDLLKSEGFDAELLTFPADGKTVYQDKRTPLAWSATKGKLTVISSPVEFENPVIADFENMPISLVKHSVSTPEGGIKARLVSEDAMKSGADCKDAMILLNPTTRARSPIITELLNRGAIGYVSSHLPGAKDTPDCIEWQNAATDDTMHWHVQCEDRDFIGFSVSPRIGKKLHDALKFGSVEVLVESDGKRYEGEVHAVSVLIPGKKKEEVWMIAHLYEPFIADNSASVIMEIAAVKHIQKLIAEGYLPELEYSIRLVFAMELYGYAAMAEHLGGSLRGKVIGGMNIDVPPIEKTDKDFTIHLSPFSSPFFGNCILHYALDNYIKTFPKTETIFSRTYFYCDDAFLGDSTVGVPIVWAEHQADDYHHNSIQSNDFLDEEKTHRVYTLYALWIYRMATCRAEDIPEYLESAIKFANERVETALSNESSVSTEKISHFIEAERSHILDFKRIADIPEIDDATSKVSAVKEPTVSVEDFPALQKAAKIIARRAVTGFPHDLIRVPKSERKFLPDTVLYGPFGLILSAMDGKTDLRTLILRSMWECGKPVTEEAVNGYIDAIEYLAKYGYLEII